MTARSSATKWPRRPLIECGTLRSGGTPTRSTSAFWGGEIPWISAKSLKHFDIVESDERLTDEGANQVGTVPKGSVLFVVRGMSLAKEFRVGVTERTVAFNQDVRALVPFGDVDGRFLARFLAGSSRQVLARVDSASHGTKRLSSDRFESIEVPLPSLDEQRRIAEVLDRAEALRAKRRAALAQLDTLTQAIFLDMFGDPALNPKGLRRAELRTLMRLRSGEFLPATKMVASGEYPVLGGNGVSGYHDQYMFDSPQLVIGRVGAYCGCVHVAPAKSWITDNALYVSERSNEVELEYLAQALRQANLNQYASQAGQPLVSGSRIYPVPILVPPLEQQREFTRRAAGVRKVRMSQRESLAQLDALFASLQHRAFRGEL